MRVGEGEDLLGEKNKGWLRVRARVGNGGLSVVVGLSDTPAGFLHCQSSSFINYSPHYHIILGYYYLLSFIYYRRLLEYMACTQKSAV